MIPATAPVSFGIFGDTHGGLTPDEIAGAIAAAGYTATELGPPGLFGPPEQTADVLSSHRLECVGAYVPFHFAADGPQFDAEVASFDRTLEELAACNTGPHTPLAVLADEGSDLLRRRPRRRHADRLGWGNDEWAIAADRIDAMASRAERAGVLASFHPHLTTFVEHREDIDSLLERTSIDLTVDSGHFLMGGMDPAAELRRLARRVNHVHVKDVRLAAVPPDEEAAERDIDDWWGGLVAPLGTGDVDLVEFVAAAVELDLRWIVIEQDRAPVRRVRLNEVVEAETANRRWLTERLG